MIKEWVEARIGPIEVGEFDLAGAITKNIINGELGGTTSLDNVNALMLLVILRIRYYGLEPYKKM